MSTRVFLFLCLLCQIVAQEYPDVTCLVINLESIRCMWNLQGTPQVNYTFYSRSRHQGETICAKYLTENGRNIGCTLPYIREQRFESFYTELRDGSKTYEKEHDLKTKVKLNPPTNLTVKNASDLNLWFYWNNTVNLSCVESRVRIRKNDNNWETLKVSRGGKHYCHSLPSSTARYELQVKSRLDENCGESEFWSDWSESVVWGFNNTTVSNAKNEAMPVWTALLYVVSAITLLLLVVILLHNERIKIILIPPLPKPALNSPDVEDWFHFSKGLVKERFNTNFNERACTVREYQPVSRSDSNGSDSSRLTTATDQTDCSIPIAENEPEDTSAPFYTTVIASEDEQQVSV
ncbi:cytokine receptor common subunit gamma isoform X1 [Poecilia formosa]|uniref:Cytokine receptor common subunit gamma n=2 Tax=Poecilia formosa TaxID=48698 RepID=A0A087XE72_POEFO|nr:PREDICTED: cytokine receptor common subunit gamma isoform X1 [Poecilia formosa]